MSIANAAIAGGGSPLTADQRSYFEPRFERDLSDVRIHTNSAANAAAAALSARAFTLGPHIAFGSGQFRPQSADGRHLLAHELAHTIQQTGAPSSPALIQRQFAEIDLEEPTPERARELREQGIELPTASAAASDPRMRSDYIENRTRAVTWGLPIGLSTGGYLLDVEGIEFPVVLPESHVRLQPGDAVRSGAINNAIYDDFGDATTAVRLNTLPLAEPYAYYRGAGGPIVAPTLFTPETTPQICSTIRDVLDEVSARVTGELIGVGVVIAGSMLVRVAIGAFRWLRGRTTRVPVNFTLASNRVWRYEGRDIVVVNTSQGPQAFYRRTGLGSGGRQHAGAQRGEWVPFDGFGPGGHFEKGRFTGMPDTDPLYRYGTEEFRQISQWLSSQNLPRGQDVGDLFGIIQSALQDLGVHLRFPDL